MRTNPALNPLEAVKKGLDTLDDAIKHVASETARSLTRSRRPTTGRAAASATAMPTESLHPTKNNARGRRPGVPYERRGTERGPDARGGGTRSGM